MYLFSVLPTTDDFIKQLNTIIYNFLWKGPDKIARVAAINKEKCGGLNLKDVGIQIKSLRLASISQLFNDSLHPWKAYINLSLKNFGGKFYLDVTMISRTLTLTLLSTRSFFSGGQSFDQNFQLSLPQQNASLGITRILKWMVKVYIIIIT